MNPVLEAWEKVQGFIESGGDVLLAIFIVTLLMWALIIERLIYFRWGHAAATMRVIRDWRMRRERLSWHAQKIRTFELSRLSQQLNQSLPMIKTLVALCPLLGLLGTVTGMIEVFDIMAIVGSGNARAMASGVSMATIPTMAGMVAALSGLYFTVRLDRLAKKKRGQVDDLLTQDGG